MKLYLFGFAALIAATFASCKKSGDNPSSNPPYVPPPAVSGQWRKMIELKDSVIGYPRMLGVGSDVFLFDGNAVYNYSIASNTLTRKPDFPAGKRSFGMVGVALSGKIYYGLGYETLNGSTTNYNDFWQYDPVTGQWSQKANCPLPSFSGAYAIPVDGKAIIGSGYNSDGIIVPDVYQFDPSANTWVKKGSYIGSTRSIYIAFGLGEYGYIGSKPDGTQLSGLYRYQLTTATWTARKRPPLDLPKLSFASDTKGYIYGDGLAAGGGNDFHEYDPATDTWMKRNDFGSDGVNATVGCFTNGKAYVMVKLSQSNNIGYAVYEYTP